MINRNFVVIKFALVVVIFFFISEICFCKVKKPYDKFSGINFQNFYWCSDTISGRYIGKSGMLVPLQIDTIEGDYYAQFDLGASASVLYENGIKNILKYNKQLS